MRTTTRTTTMEWLHNEVRHWSRIVDLLKQEEEKMAEGEEAVKDKWKEGEGGGHGVEKPKSLL